MKVNELMLNDWVKVKGSKSKALCYKVDVISNFGFYDAITCGEYDFQEEDIEPIPLTEEILKANGFELSEDEDMWCVDDFYVTVGFTQLIGGSRWITYNFVHELQHALRLCGLDELADNFKV